MGGMGSADGQPGDHDPNVGGSVSLKKLYTEANGRTDACGCPFSHFAPQTSYWDEYTNGTPGVGVRSVHQAVQHERYMTKRLALGPYSPTSQEKGARELVTRR